MNVNGTNTFNPESFAKMCRLLEAGKTIEIQINCIGHTRRGMMRDAYRQALEEKYRDRLEVVPPEAAYHFKLKRDPNAPPVVYRAVAPLSSGPRTFSRKSAREYHYFWWIEWHSKFNGIQIDKGFCKDAKHIRYATPGSLFHGAPVLTSGAVEI